MDRTNDVFSDGKDLNLLQIVAINVVATLAALGGALALGVSLAAAFIAAWLLGGVATVCAAATISLARERLRSKVRQSAGSPALVPANVSDPMQLWEADRLMEIEHARTILDNTSGEKARRDTLESHWSLWADAQSAEGEKPEASRRDEARRRAG